MMLGDIVANLALDKKKFEAGLAGAGKDTKRFGGDLTRELSQATRQVESLAAAYVQGGKVTRAELDAAIAKEKRLHETIAARKSLLNSLRGTGADLAEIGPTVASQRVQRTEEAQLTALRARMQELAAESVRSGRDAGRSLERLTRLEANLTARIADRATMLERVRQGYQRQAAAMAAAFGRSQSTFRPGMAGGGVGGGGLGAGGLGTGLAYGLSDAVTAAQFGGGKAAALSISNNLPMIGEGLGSVAAKFATGTSAASKFAGVLASMAGPAGLIASVAVPLAAVLVPSLIDFKSAAEKAAEAAEKRKQQVEKDYQQALATGSFNAGNSETGGADSLIAQARGRREYEAGRLALHRRMYGSEESRQGAVTELGQRVDLGQTARRDIKAAISRQLGFVRGASQRGDAEGLQREQAVLAELFTKRAEVQKTLTADEKQLAEAENSLSVAVRKRLAADAARPRFGVGSDAYRAKLEAEEQKASEDRLAAAKRAGDANDRRSLLAGVGGQLGMLQRQREALERSGRSFQRPEAVDRFNSLDRILDVVAQHGKARQDADKKEEMQRLDKQIQWLEKIYEAVRKGGTNLKPAGIA